LSLAVEHSAEAVAVAPLDVPPTEKQVVETEVPAQVLASTTDAEPTRDAYILVIDSILALLKEPQSDEWVADKVCVRAAQMKDWLDRGVREGRILKLKKPVRYVAHIPTLLAMATERRGG
jgi:hypothetical protein